MVKAGWGEANRTLWRNASAGLLANRSATAGYMYATAFSDSFLRSGGGDTAAEKWMLVVLDVFQNLVFSGIAGGIFAVISSMNIDLIEKNKKKSEWQEFGAAKKLSATLQLELMDQFNSLYEHKTVFNEEAIMNDLPTHMRSKIVQHMYEDLISNSMFFDGFERYNETAVMRICMKLETVVVQARDNIYSEGDIGEDMYFIQEGSVQVTVEHVDLGQGVRANSNLSRVDTKARRLMSPNSRLLVEFEYDDHNDIELDEQFMKLVRPRNNTSWRVPAPADNAKAETDANTQVEVHRLQHYKRFREQLDHVSGLFKATGSPGMFQQEESVRDQYEHWKERLVARKNSGAGDRDDRSPGDPRGRVKKQWVLKFDQVMKSWCLRSDTLEVIPCCWSLKELAALKTAVTPAVQSVVRYVVIHYIIDLLHGAGAA